MARTALATLTPGRPPILASPERARVAVLAGRLFSVLLDRAPLKTGVIAGISVELAQLLQPQHDPPRRAARRKHRRH